MTNRVSEKINKKLSHFPPLPKINEPVVLKIETTSGDIKYRVESLDNPAFRHEFRTLHYDAYGFLLESRHEKRVLAWASIPSEKDSLWHSPSMAKPRHNAKVLTCIIAHHMITTFFAVTHRDKKSAERNQFVIPLFAREVLRWCSISQLNFINLDSHDF